MDDLECGTLTARRIKLLDDEQRIRLSIEEEGMGAFAIRFFDQDGLPTVNLGLAADGQANLLFFRGGKLHLMLGVMNDGHVRINGYGQNDKGGFQLDVQDKSANNTNSHSMLRFTDSSGRNWNSGRATELWLG
jgi:hypothetical protein